MAEVFSPRRAGIVAWRVLRQIIRDKRTLGMMIAMPTVIMLIFGFALSGDVRNIPVLIENLDEGYTTQPGLLPAKTKNFDDIAKALQTDVRIKFIEGDYAEGVKGVDHGDYSASVRIPVGFSEAAFKNTLGSDSPATIDVYIDATKPAIKGSILAALQSALKDAFGGVGVDIRQVNAFGGAEYSGLDVSIPSVIGFVLTFLVLLISLIIIAKENYMGTLQRLYSTPLTALERLLGYVAALLVLGMMMSGVILAVGVGVFHVTVKGSIPLLIAAAFVYALSHVLLAVFLSNFAKNELQAVQIAPLISLPSMALSGMPVPVNSLPEAVQALAKLVPLYYGNRIFDGIMLKGYGIQELSGDLLVVCGMAVLFLLLALTTVKDRIDA